MEEADNLLTALHKWAHRQDENFVTDAFAHLLRHLLRAAPSIACDVVGLLTDKRLELRPEQCSDVSVVTQSPSETGTPDITIEWETSLLFVEAKVDSGFGSTQLRRYRRLLNKRIECGDFTAGCLTTLTRRKPSPSAVEEFDCVPVRWQTIVEHLDRIPAESVQDPNARFLIRQLTNFLRGRMIEMQQITPELTAGVLSLRRMLEMIWQSLKDHHVAVHQKMSGWYKVGYWLNKKRWRIAISYKHPHVVVFETCDVPISDAHVAEILEGRFQKSKKGNKKLQWVNVLDLNENDGEFYQLPPDQQKDRLDAFVEASARVAKRIDEMNK